MSSSKQWPKRGEIFWVNLDPTIGTEAKKVRPALVISNDFGNELSPRVIVAPITSQIDKVYPFEAKLILQDKTRKAMLDQIRSVDKRRLGSKIASVMPADMVQVERALRIVLDLA